MNNDKSKILVSICCITYNHAPFIRKALDGFLMQQPPSCVPQEAKMSDWCEILIHDDCSTDGTTEIIEEYSAKYPDVIYPLYEDVNQYSKGVKVDFYNYNRARGKYIAYCEGDDYWTDSTKLQKQVDFLERHLDYSICMHGCDVYDVRINKQYESHDFDAYIHSKNEKNDEGVNITMQDFFKGHYAYPLTMLFRLSMFNFGWHNQYKYYRDTHEIYHLLKAGKGYWMNFNGGVYVKHNGGVSTSVTIDKSCWEEREHVLELYLHNRDDKELRAYLIKILLWNYDVFKKEGRVSEFNTILKSLYWLIPSVMAEVYWIIIKRAIKNAWK